MSLATLFDPENPAALWSWGAVGLPSSLCTGTSKDLGVIIDPRTGEERRPIACANCGVRMGTIRGWDRVIVFCDRCEAWGAGLVFPECTPAFVQYLEHQAVEAARRG